MISRNKQLTFLFAVFVVGFVFFPGFVQAMVTDTDRDGLSDSDEFKYFTSSTMVDTDSDGYSDSEEVKNGYSPLVPKKTMGENDHDRDGLSDWLELWFGSKIGVPDTDGDMVSDYDEIMRGLSPTQTSTSTRFIRRIEVDLTTQRLFYFVDRVKIHNFPVSTGNPATPTPPGEYSIMSLIANKRYVGADYNLPGVKWNMAFLGGGYYIHGAYWHNDFGKRTHSHGCINMRTEDAGILYQYMDIGVPVTVTGTTPGRFFVGT